MRWGRVTEPSDRAQSAIDFIIGFGIFFLTLSFVLVLIPELLSPFSGQEGPVVADRAIETLSGELLATGTVGGLNETCTAEFFDGSGTTCSFDASDPTADVLGISDAHSLNVTLEQNTTVAPGTEVVCYDGNSVVDCSSNASALTLARGPDPPGRTQSVRSARRLVSLGGEQVFLKLRVW